jgi:hypothetical protein
MKNPATASLQWRDFFDKLFLTNITSLINCQDKNRIDQFLIFAVAPVMSSHEEVGTVNKNLVQG